MVDVVGPSAVPDISQVSPSRYDSLLQRINDGRQTDFRQALRQGYDRAVENRSRAQAFAQQQLEPAAGPDTFLGQLLQNDPNTLIEQQQALALATQARLAGINPDNESSGQQNNQNTSIATVTPPSDFDLRARLRAKPHIKAYQLLYSDNPWLNLAEYGGMIWPYTPTITYAQDVTYESMGSVHTNQEMMAYTRTPATKLTVAGTFTSQTQLEATYNLACIHFLRLATKMSFGSSVSPQPGTPPPVLFFDAHGGGMFRSLPVVITNFSVTLPNEPDYVTVPNAIAQTGKTANPKTTRVPALFEITVSLTVQHTPRALRQWSIDKFRAGGYITNTAQAGWI